MLRTNPPTHIISSRPLSPSEAHTFLTSFIHFTNATRPNRNRRLAPVENVPLLSFSPSVLNSLNRIEMGLRGEYVRPEPTTTTTLSFRRKAKRRKLNPDGDEEEVQQEVEEAGNESGGIERLLPRMDQSAYESGADVSVMEGRETRLGGDAVGDAPAALLHGNPGMAKKEKERRKTEKKARRKGEKKAREEARKKAKEDKIDQVGGGHQN